MLSLLRKLLIFSFALLYVAGYLMFGNLTRIQHKIAVVAQEPQSDVIRGQSDDLWADIVIGKRDFGEIAPRKVVSYKVFNPGGIVVDKPVSKNFGRAYIWDSGNNRILGIDLDKCFAEAGPCSADIVIGQPFDDDYGACNHDSSYESYPNRANASISSICGIHEKTHTVLEDKTFVSMYIDNNGNLFVPDSFNHRVLKFNNPFDTDSVADEIWGQSNFTNNLCNQGNHFPTNNTLCFHSNGSSGAGVTLDSEGNLWVADGGNNRVLRFPVQDNGRIAKEADLILGQPNFATGGDFSGAYCRDLNEETRTGIVRCSKGMRAPTAITFDDDGNLYIADTENWRILVFNPPFSNYMPANYIYDWRRPVNLQFQNPLGLRIDPHGRGIWVLDGKIPGRLSLWNTDFQTMETFTFIGMNAGGSIDFDNQGNLLVSTYVGHDVFQFKPNSDGTYSKNRRLFYPPLSYNLTTKDRLEHPGKGGIAVVANQLIVADGRLLYWNNILRLRSGIPPDGYVAASSFVDIPKPGFRSIKTDENNYLWASKWKEIWVFQMPLQTEDPPLKIIRSPISVLGEGSIIIDDIHGIAPSKDGKFLWVSQATQNRVVRIRNPLSSAPIVDIILGQKTVDGTACNRGEIDPPSSGEQRLAELDMLCYPGSLSIDKQGNLYVSDHTIESAGNWRLLMFSRSLFPDNPSDLILAPPATKSFPAKRSNDPNSPAFYPHMTFEAAFDSHNRMVVGNNPYSGKRFVDYYNDPTLVNPNNPSDPSFAVPDGQLKDFYSWPMAITFDRHDNLYVYDVNRGQVRIYKTPFGCPELELSCKGHINLPDILNWRRLWEAGNTEADIIDNGQINILDYLFILRRLLEQPVI